jgi:hypothetical protein
MACWLVTSAQWIDSDSRSSPTPGEHSSRYDHSIMRERNNELIECSRPRIGPRWR